MSDTEQGRTIWKIKLPYTLSVTKELPGFIKALHVHEQGGQVCVWVLLDSGSEVLHRVKFQTVGTGWDCGSSKVDGDYIGSAHVDEFVWHVFMKVQS